MLTGDNGIITKSIEAKEKTSSSQADEENNLNNVEKIIDEHINPKKEADELKIGDYVEYIYDEAENYTYTSEESSASYDFEQSVGLKWRIRRSIK